MQARGASELHKPYSRSSTTFPGLWSQHCKKEHTGGILSPTFQGYHQLGLGFLKRSKKKKKKKETGTKEIEEQTSSGFQLLRSSNKMLKTLLTDCAAQSPPQRVPQHSYWKINSWLGTVQHLPARLPPAQRVLSRSKAPIPSCISSPPGFDVWGLTSTSRRSRQRCRHRAFGSSPHMLRISQKQPQIRVRLAGCWMAYALQTDGPYFSHSHFTHLRFVRETKAFVYGYKRQWQLA